MADLSPLPIEELSDAFARVRAFLADHCDEFGVAVIDVAGQRIAELEAIVRLIDESWTEDFPAGPETELAAGHFADDTLAIWRRIRALNISPIETSDDKLSSVGGKNV